VNFPIDIDAELRCTLAEIRLQSPETTLIGLVLAATRHLVAGIIRLSCVGSHSQERCVSMSENSTCLGSGQGIGPVRRPLTKRIGASGLSGKPNRRSISLKLAAIWGMSA